MSERSQEECPHCNECSHYDTLFDAALRETTILKSQLQRAVEGLRRYGAHNNPCKATNYYPGKRYGDGPCTCGLEALLADLEGSGAK